MQLTMWVMPSALSVGRLLAAWKQPQKRPPTTSCICLCSASSNALDAAAGCSTAEADTRGRSMPNSSSVFSSDEEASKIWG